MKSENLAGLENFPFFLFGCTGFQLQLSIGVNSLLKLKKSENSEL